MRVSATDCYSVFVSWSGLLHLENATGDSFHRAGVCHPLPWNLWRFNPSDVKTAQTAKTERAEIPRKQLEKTVISVHLLRVRIELDRSTNPEEQSPNDEALARLRRSSNSWNDTLVRLLREQCIVIRSCIISIHIIPLGTRLFGRCQRCKRCKRLLPNSLLRNSWSDIRASSNSGHSWSDSPEGLCNTLLKSLE